MIFKILLIIVSALTNISFAGTRDPNVSDQKYVTYAKDFIYVGKLYGKYADGTQFCASAVAIDDHNILTAAHVVNNSIKCCVYFNNKEYCLDNIIMHKDFSDRVFGTADIAIGHSEESFNLRFYPDLYDDDDEIGKVCTLAGYGFHGTFLTGAKLYDDKRRAGSNIIDYVDKDMLICSPSKLNDKTRTSLEFLIASGDSGGGLFLENRLAGIHSCIMSVDKSPSAKYNEESGHTRISKFIPWINEHKKK